MKQANRKPINPDLIILACLTATVLFFTCCSLIRINIFEKEPGKCISFSIFGKLELLGVNKVTISVYDKEIVITDKSLVDQIVSETKVATHIDSDCEKDCCGCYDPHWQIGLYRGDHLVRSMEWETCCGAMKVYEPDLTHWLIGPSLGDAEKVGYVELSDELIEQLQELVTPS